jgi:hypothetical protein
MEFQCVFSHHQKNKRVELKIIFFILKPTLGPPIKPYVFQQHWHLLHHSNLLSKGTGGSDSAARERERELIFEPYFSVTTRKFFFSCFPQESRNNCNSSCTSSFGIPSFLFFSTTLFHSCSPIHGGRPHLKFI